MTIFFSRRLDCIVFTQCCFHDGNILPCIILPSMTLSIVLDALGANLFLIKAVHNTTPLMAGVRCLPYSLGSAVASMPAAWYISAFPDRAGRSRKEVMIAGLAIASLGFGEFGGTGVALRSSCNVTNRSYDSS